MENELDNEIKGKEPKSRKFSCMFMLEVKANSGNEKQIRFLIDNLVTLIPTLYPSSKVGVTSLDREK